MFRLHPHLLCILLFEMIFLHETLQLGCKFQLASLRLRYELNMDLFIELYSIKMFYTQGNVFRNVIKACTRVKVWHTFGVKIFTGKQGSMILPDLA